ACGNPRFHPCRSPRRLTVQSALQFHRLGESAMASRNTEGTASLDKALDVLDAVGSAARRLSQAEIAERLALPKTTLYRMLAALAAPQSEQFVRDIPLTAVTPHSITDGRRLQAQLKVTAARGYAIDDEEVVLGVRCCGAPIVDAAGQVRGAISVAGRAFRLTMKRVELLGPEVAQAARRIGAQLDAAKPRAADSPVEPIDGSW